MQVEVRHKSFMEKRKFFAFIVTGIVVVGLALFYYSNNPAQSPYTLGCTFKKVTGLECTGCGGQRSFHHLLHFRWSEALQSNLLFVLYLPVLIYYLFVVISQTIFKVKIKEIHFLGKNFGTISLILIIAFTILRNIPYYPFTLLKPLSI